MYHLSQGNISCMLGGELEDSVSDAGSYSLADNVDGLSFAEELEKCGLKQSHSVSIYLKFESIKRTKFMRWWQ